MQCSVWNCNLSKSGAKTKELTNHKLDYVTTEAIVANFIILFWTLIGLFVVETIITAVTTETGSRVKQKLI